MANNQIYAIEGARITFRNFSGEARKFNAAGNRNFNIILTEKDRDMLADAGFKIRVRPPKDSYSEPQYLLPVMVSYKFRPPKITTIVGHVKSEMTEDNVGELDYADIENIDLTIRPYHWEMPDGTSGVKAYLNSMYVTLVKDVFADKYDFGEDVIDEEEPF